MKFKIDRFVLAIIATITFAYFFPQWGIEGSGFPISTVSSIGFFLIFFFYGLKLSPQQIKSGLFNWKLHVLVQLSTFLLFPLLVLMFYPFVQTEEQHSFWLALLFMAALPSTVSSSVVMVSVARGNVPAAIFNASISGIIGILITPLWVGLFIEKGGAEFDYSTIYLNLILGIVLPVVLGIALQKFGHALAIKYSKQLSNFDKSVILLVIYKSFAESFHDNIFSSIKLLDFVILFVIVIAIFFIIFTIVGFIASKLKFSTEDKITAQFCGTKKSLVHGTIFYKILFKNTAASSLVLLPLMIFHASQILIISILASKFAKRDNKLGV
ncbi:bile acid:sodium symporter family protein [Formosa sp. PL04]|uniref:bile acid:sodium symporter family protein n=1 Tax=Formosa sp. PL04 TaxID=3081755 RepID=UPI002980CAFC|nr:bile acid:sodium symporter family protein [Formosa sp. PL04]MDW5288661.1 bile acid:sodium symporter family protein [Formosa sp. PL04]